jgi:hypothetical protein
MKILILNKNSKEDINVFLAKIHQIKSKTQNQMKKKKEVTPNSIPN